MVPNPINQPLGRVAIDNHSTRLRFLLLIIGLLLLAACSRSVNPPAEPPAPQWDSQDIGQVSIAGSVEFFSDEHVVVQGSGTDIWGDADSFHFAYQTLQGDGTITARVVSIDNTHQWAKAGVMIREQLTPESKHALVALTPQGIVEFNWRPETSGLTSNQGNRQVSGSPHWIRLVRQGHIFSAYESADGAAWQLVHSTSIVMAKQVYVGLAVTSRVNSELAQGELNQVIVQSNPNSPSTPAITSVTINEADQSLVVGGTFDFSVVVAAVGGANPAVTWSSSNEALATVDANGVVTGVAVGTATITATSMFDGSKTASVVVTVSATSPPPRQASYYISPSGSDSNNGRTLSTPFRTIQRAASVVRPGDLVYLRGGSHFASTYIDLVSPGTSEQPIVWESYPGERAVINGRDAPNGGRGAGFVRIFGSHQVFRNLDITNTPQHGFLIIDANHIVFDGVHGYFNRGTPINGFRTSNSLFINNVLCDNADPQNGYDDADGLTVAYGDNNVIRHNLFCRNSDDGLDIWRSTNTLVEYNIAYRNGYNSTGSIYHNNLANGFKLGVYNLSDGGGHTVRFNLAYNNTGFGFMDNAPASGFTPITFYNNTAWNNAQVVGWARDISFLSAIPHVVRNNLAVLGPNSLASSAFQLSSTVIRSHNGWDLGISNPNFISLDPSSAFFLALAQNSPAIDAGRAMGVPYSGAAPDLGALEFGQTIADLLAPNMMLTSSRELYANR